MHTIFELHIWHRADQSCFFLLQWQGRTKQLTASIPYSREVQHYYQRWQQRYLRYYEFPTPPVSGSGRLNPGTGDPAHDLMQAEQELIQAFQHWLAEGETRKLQQQIRDELSRMNHHPGDRRSSPTIPTCIDLFLAVDSPELARLPWETWELAPQDAQMRLRVIRTAMEVRQPPPLPVRPKKPRILVILGDDANLPLQQHWQALQALKPVATLHRLTWSPQEDVVAIKDRIAQTIGDRQGWDVLFFVGHSQETAVTGGRFMITPTVVLAISELEESLTQACDRGLQLAIFNSCSGLDIAHALTRLGLQVVAMREPIRADVAQQFLHHLCQALAQHQPIPTAVRSACQYLQSAHQFNYPSAALLPLLFSPANVAPYQFAPPHWQQWLRQFTPSRQWLPTPLEAVTLAIMLLASSGLASPITDSLLEIRYLVQAVYYDLTNQLPPQKSPPVLLIGIDQESLDRAKTTIPAFKDFPLDRRYLAQIVAKTAPLKARVLGIDYLLDTEQPHEQALNQAIQAIVATKQAWFVFAADKQTTLFDEATKSKWSLKGNNGLYLSPPEDKTCPTELCPFTYVLALATVLSQSPSPTNLPQPHLDSQEDFKLAVSNYLRDRNPEQSPIAQLSLTNPPLGMSIVTDFALPPDHAYKLMPAWELLNTSQPDATWLQAINQPIILIASFRYAKAEDSYGSFLYNQYWCSRQQKQTMDCATIAGAEIHAYSIHQLLSSHQIIRLPDAWMICLMAILGKGISLRLHRQPDYQRRYLLLGLVGTTGLYGAIGLQLYVSASTLIPWLFPSILFWIYLGFDIAKISHHQPPKSLTSSRS